MPEPETASTASVVNMRVPNSASLKKLVRLVRMPRKEGVVLGTNHQAIRSCKSVSPFKTPPSAPQDLGALADTLGCVHTAMLLFLLVPFLAVLHTAAATSDNPRWTATDSGAGLHLPLFRRETRRAVKRDGGTAAIGLGDVLDV